MRGSCGIFKGTVAEQMVGPAGVWVKCSLSSSSPGLLPRVWATALMIWKSFSHLSSTCGRFRALWVQDLDESHIPTGFPMMSACACDNGGAGLGYGWLTALTTQRSKLILGLVFRPQSWAGARAQSGIGVRTQPRAGISPQPVARIRAHMSYR